ncbi:MAG: aldo/keto reductase [Bacteroidales bacterium]|nr:aldo/keto reductase [Bacteroidales bacterium]
MQTVILGKSQITVPKNGFGALPIQRISLKEAVYLLQKAFDNGMYYFDTARFYTDSEEKLGAAFQGKRDQIIISSKTGATSAENFWKDLEISLKLLKTDYIDLYQFHNPAFCPKPGDGSGLYEAMLEAQKQGKVKHIGISNHRLAVATEAIASGLYETLQFPFSYLATDEDLRIVRMCREANMGFIAMKALAGGLITNAAAAYAYLAQFEHVVPIWGIQRESELDEFIGFQDNPPSLTDDLIALIRKDREELSGNFCRGCGYCEPCPAGIEINNCNRMSLFLKRAPLSVYLTAEWAEKMKKIENCIHCGQCAKKCPYGLNTPELLQQNYEDFKKMWKY